MKTTRTLVVAVLALVSVMSVRVQGAEPDYEQAARHAKVLMAKSKEAYSGIMQLSNQYSGYREPMRVDDRDVFKQSLWIYEHFSQGAENHDEMVARSIRVRKEIKMLLIRADKVLQTAANNGDSDTKQIAYDLLDCFKRMELEAKSMYGELTGN